MDSAALAFLVGMALTLAVVWLRRYHAYAGRILAEAELRRASRELALQRGEVERLHELFSTALQAFPQPVLVTTRERTILLANPAALQLVGMSADQAIGSVVARVIRDYETTQLLMEAARANERQERTFVRAATGETWHVAVTPLRLDEPGSQPGGPAGIPAQTQPDSLPPDPTHLILTIEDLSELRRLETIRRDFVAHVSHELRTPLAAVRLQAETLLSALHSECAGEPAHEPGHDPGRPAELASRILDEVDHLTQMVAELLELSRIESGKTQLQREPTDVAGLVEVVIDRMTPLAKERLVRLVPALREALPDALIDSRRIEEVLVNLIDNALKYTRPGGVVTLRAEVQSAAAAETAFQTGAPGIRGVKCARPRLPAEGAHEPVGEDAPGSEANVLVVRVTDTGVGIAPEDLPRIFERFYKADRARTRLVELPAREHSKLQVNGAVSHAAAGTGLGLAITKHLVELHGGHIWATSGVGRGSTFCFTLPLATRNASHAGSRERSESLRESQVAGEQHQS